MANSKLDVIDPETTPLMTYESSIRSGAHGDVYQKQIAQLILLRLTRERRDFRLAYELTSADKFDDVVVYDNKAKQWIFLQSKHVDGKDSKIDLNGLLPKANRAKGDFSLYKYFTSYMLIRSRFKGELKFLLFTNKKLDEKLKTAGDHLSIEDRDVDEYLRFTYEGATHKLLTPTESTVQSIVEYVNNDFYSLKDAIKQLFTEGIVRDELFKYKAHLNDILVKSGKHQIRFKKTFNDSLIFIAKLYKVLLSELPNVKPIDKPPEFVVEETEYEYSSYPSVEDQDFEHLIDGIKDLFHSGIVSDHLKQYKNLLALILTTTQSGQLTLKDKYNCDIFWKAELYRMLKAELSDMHKNVTTKLFDGKDSRFEPHPVLYADASDVRHFFALLTLSVHQPDELEPFIVEELHLWIRTWLRPDVLGRLTGDDDKNAVHDLDGYFDATLKCEQGNAKRYLNQEFVTEYCNKLRANIEERHSVRYDTNQLYINRVLIFEKVNIDASESLQDSQFDGTVESEVEHCSGRLVSYNSDPVIKRLLTHDYMSLTDTTYMEMTDSQFAANLKLMLSHYKCLVLTADPGIGKTKLLQYVALEHQKLKAGAVFLIYLNTIQDYKYDCGNESPLGILASALSAKNFEFIQNVLDRNTDDHITMLFDGYDEIHEKNRNKIDNLFEFLMSSEHFQLIISVRSHKKSLLQSLFKKHNLNVRYFSLESFSSNNIIDYLAQSWNENIKSDVDPRFNTYSKCLIKKMYSLCRVPLMTKMVSEIYKSRYEWFKASCTRDVEIEMSYLDKEFAEVEHIYEKFMDKCLLIKTEDAFNGFGKVDSNDQILDGFYVDHQLLAIKLLEVNELKFIFRNPKYKKKWDNIQTCLKKQFDKSILVKFVDDKVCFTHYSYAEYFVANFLWDNFEFVKNIIKNVLFDFSGIRNFFIKIIEKEINFFISEIDQQASFLSDEFILWACESNAIELLKYALSKENLHIPKQDKMLHIAIINGSDKICSYLIDECQVHLDDEYVCGFVHLYMATACDQRHIVLLLLAKGANINIQSPKALCRTSLHCACMYGQRDIVEILIKAKANIDALDHDNWTPLHYACLNGHKEIVDIFIREKVRIDALSNEGCTPLHYACLNGQKEVVEILIREKANIEALSLIRHTPLHLACQNGHEEVVEILIAQKSNTEAMDHESCTPLHVACQNGHKEVLEILIRGKANIDALALDQCTPLHFACKNGHAEVVDILIREKAKIDALNYANWTPLHYACLYGHKDVVKILIREKANIDALALNKCTPLHFACQIGYAEIVEMLIRENAEIDALNYENWTPLHFACWNGHKEVVKILIKENADIDALNDENCTPLYLACEYGHEEVEMMIREKVNAAAIKRSTIG